MPRYKLWIDVSIATASVVLGIIISPIFERLVDPLFGSETRASLVGILVLGLVTNGASLTSAHDSPMLLMTKP